MSCELRSEPLPKNTKKLKASMLQTSVCSLSMNGAADGATGVLRHLTVSLMYLSLLVRA